MSCRFPKETKNQSTRCVFWFIDLEANKAGGHRVIIQSLLKFGFPITAFRQLFPHPTGFDVALVVRCFQTRQRPIVHVSRGIFLIAAQDFIHTFSRQHATFHCRVSAQDFRHIEKPRGTPCRKERMRARNNEARNSGREDRQTQNLFSILPTVGTKHTMQKHLPIKAPPGKVYFGID